MEKERVWREFAALSEKDQRKVVDFIVSLRKEDDTYELRGREAVQTLGGRVVRRHLGKARRHAG